MIILSKILANALGGIVFFCPGCDMIHTVWTKEYNRGDGKPLWEWNGDLVKPTFSPSVLVHLGSGRQCHSFVRDGKIQYLGDCTHDLKGKTVDIPELPDWFVEGELFKPE